MRTKHEQVPTSKQGVLVDKEILPIIEMLWKLGANTRYSCIRCGTDEQPKSYINFETRQDAEILTDILYDAGYQVSVALFSYVTERVLVQKYTTPAMQRQVYESPVSLENTIGNENWTVRYHPALNQTLLNYAEKNNL